MTDAIQARLNELATLLAQRGIVRPEGSTVLTIMPRDAKHLRAVVAFAARCATTLGDISLQGGGSIAGSTAARHLGELREHIKE